MTDTATLPAAALSAAGVTILGVNTGLDPSVMLAGLAGGLWAQSYAGTAPLWQRALISLLSAVLSGYLAPATALGLASLESARGAGLSVVVLQFPAAVLVGFLAHRVLGPSLEWFVNKKVKDTAQ